MTHHKTCNWALAKPLYHDVSVANVSKGTQKFEIKEIDDYDMHLEKKHLSTTRHAVKGACMCNELLFEPIICGP